MNISRMQERDQGQSHSRSDAAVIKPRDTVFFPSFSTTTSSSPSSRCSLNCQSLLRRSRHDLHNPFTRVPNSLYAMFSYRAYKSMLSLTWGVGGFAVTPSWHIHSVNNDCFWCVSRASISHNVVFRLITCLGTLRAERTRDRKYSWA